MLVSTTVFTCLLCLVGAEPFNGYELGNYIGLLVYHDTPPLQYVKFPSDDSSRIIRKSHYREFDHPPSSVYFQTPGFMNFHPGNAPPFPPNHGPPPFSSHHHRGPPSNAYGPPPPFAKPPSFHHGPHHHRHSYHRHSPPHAFDSSENYNFGSWESHEYDDANDEHTNCKGASHRPRPEVPQKQPIFSTTFSALPNKRPSVTTNSQQSGSFPLFRPTPSFTVATTATGTTISAPNGLISGNINHGNCQQQSTLANTLSPSDQPNNFVTTSQPALSSEVADVSSLINGVFPMRGQQTDQQSIPNIPTTPGKDIDSLVSGVFPGLAGQTSQSSTPPAVATSVDSLLGGVFPNLNTQSNQPQQQDIPNTPPVNVESLVAGVFTSTQRPNIQSGQQATLATSEPSVEAIIAGVFSGSSENQQSANASSSTAASSSNGLISGVFQGFAQQGGRTSPPTFSPSPGQTNQNNDDSIPVFQPDIPTSSSNQQLNSFDSSSSDINSSQKIPVFQPPIAATSDIPGVVSTASGNDNAAVIRDTEDDPAFDIDIRLGQIGDEVTPSINQRNRTPTT